MSKIEGYMDLDFSHETAGQFPNQKILVIANCENPALNYIHLLRYLKYDIFWVGRGASGDENSNQYLDLNGYTQSRKLSDYLEAFNVPHVEKQFSLKGLLEFLNMDFKLILHFQNQWYPTDKGKSPIPYIFIPSETWIPNIPECAHFTTYAGMGMRDMILKYHPNIPLIGYLPYPLNTWLEPNMHVIPKSKKYKVSFSGNLFTFSELYKERREILKFLKEKLGKTFKLHYQPPPEKGYPEFDGQKGEGKKRILQPHEYRNLLQRSKIGVSIPTIFGSPFRDIEIAACNSLLLTMPTRDLTCMGFKPEKNYVPYTTKEEALAFIEGSNEEDNARIARAGQMLVLSAHLVIHRAPMLEAIMSVCGVNPRGIKLGLWIPNQPPEQSINPHGFEAIFCGDFSRPKVPTHKLQIGDYCYMSAPLEEKEIEFANKVLAVV
jgi:hypothetical protein